MAIRLLIDNADHHGLVDYTRYLAAPDRTPAVLRDEMNLPARLDFVLMPADLEFRAPSRSAYVRLEGLAESLPPGGPRVPGPLFTGFVTHEPEVEFLGVANGQPVYGFHYQATSEEYLLNVKRLGPLPPFLNQTAGQILRFLVEHLLPGRFDTTAVAEGARIPVFRVDPEAAWSDVARELAERSGYYYRVLDRKVIFQPIGDAGADVVVDERDPRFRPDALEIQPVGNAIQNDVTVFGAVEPQAFVQEHFVGDGFTSKFLLSAPVFGAESARLLADDFTGDSLDPTRWQETDPGNHIQLFEGRLNVTGGSGTLGETTLLARQMVELAGELEIIHGEFEFVRPSQGILGGLYDSAALAAANCLVGFDVAPMPDATRLRARVRGVVQPLEVITQANHHYVLVTRLSADQPFRVQQSFASSDGTRGGSELAARVQVTLEVRDLDLADPTLPAVTVLYAAALDDLPAVALYAPINSADLHLAVNFLQIARPVQARLVTQKPGEPPRTRRLGFGIAGQDATITSDPNQNQWALEFYPDTIPETGERITLYYREAGRARARVRDAASIAREAALAGDDGVRAAVLRDLTPMPRTSAEAEAAALAYLSDHTAPRYEGRYTTWSDFTEQFPRSGRLVEVRNESRYPTFRALVRKVSSEFRELVHERILHTLEFGQPSRIEQMLRRLVPAPELLQPEEPVALPAVDVAELEGRFVPESAGVTLAGVAPTHYLIDMGAPPPAQGIFEVRRSDQGWSSQTSDGSTQNLLATASTQTFVVPRSARRHVFFIRPVLPDGTTSRYSSIVGIHYPLVPPAPEAVVVEFGLDARRKPIITIRVTIGEENLQDVDRVELRDGDNTTVLARWTFGQLQLEDDAYHATLVLDNSTALLREKIVFAYTQNTLGEYSAPTSGTGAQPEPAKPQLTPGNSVGQIVEIRLDRSPAEIQQTQIQVADAATGFDEPEQDVTFDGQPEKFSFVAPRSGDWMFRARRRDALGWTPWSNEPQGQIPAQLLVFSVRFFRARELDPSIGAAVNAQNLLPNSDFFLPGISGQEGTAAPRYYGLVNAAPDGSEMSYLPATNEVEWRAGVSLAQANPGLQSRLSNLGRLLNPGEPLTLSAALRHTGTAVFPHPVRYALRSSADPTFALSGEIAAGTITAAYQWYSVTFLLPADRPVPADLSVEITVGIEAGQSLASALRCDKLVLNRGHRPAAFSFAPWDILALPWNSSAQAYDLPETIVASTPRSADAGGAGRLMGTGTEDLDPDFTERYHRLVV
ncbi:MAG: hypothetical protein K6U09_06810 [Acidobacteriia bacterium]|jgi:hypothetical protein|nr:hypothetical protein [Terriglobia bacterium]